LDAKDIELIGKARRASAQAYAPYSKLKVGAAVRTSTGRIFLGCNVENASYSLTSCAERNAIFAAVAEEGPSMQLEDVAIFANAERVSPCGACRQVLAEFGANARVLFPEARDIQIMTMEQLLPTRFKLAPGPSAERQS